MRKADAFLVVVLVGIALAAGIEAGLFRSAPDRASETSGPARLTEAAARHPREELHAQPSVPPAQRDSPAITPHTSLAPAGSLPEAQRSSPSGSTQAHAAPLYTEDQLQESESEEEALTDADAVIGRPFPTSPSVLKGCKSFGKYCEADLEVLRALGEEPRDRAWARRMESKIRARVASEEPGKYSIRALECRTSLCAAEVVSHFGPYTGSYPAGDPDLHFDRGVAFGREFDRSSWTPLTITLVLYWRYPSDAIPE